MSYRDKNKYLTETQRNYAYDLLRKIGYRDESIICELIDKYEEKHISKSYYSETVNVKNSKGRVYKSYEVNNFKYVNYTIEVLLREIEIREEIEVNKNRDDFYISASDLLSYSFCEVSFSIVKSFIIDDEKNLNLFRGTKLHEQFRVIFKRTRFQDIENKFTNFTEKQMSFLSKINSCELIYSGHNSNAIFLNEESKYKGQPDYIFKDLKGNYFVIEEKFHLTSNKNEEFQNMFYFNHLIQLQSYIELIKEYDIKYGIVIDWYYYVKDDNLIIEDFKWKIIYKNGEFKSLLFENIEKIKLLKERKKIDYKHSQSLNKCFGCSVKKYCGHKTDYFQVLEYPYDKKFLFLR